MSEDIKIDKLSFPQELVDQSPRFPTRHEGPSAEEYMAAHPEVDWDLHEVLYTIVNAGQTRQDGFIRTRIDGHHVKPDYEALYAELRRMNDEEQFDYRKFVVDGVTQERIIIKLPFFQELITSRAKLWALESAGVDNWEGYSEAMSEELGDAWVKEIGRGQE